jgi:hypothetical protein
MTNSSAPYDANGNDKECFMIDVNINILPLVEGVMHGRLPHEKNSTRDNVEGSIFFLSLVIYHNTLN